MLRKNDVLNENLFEKVIKNHLNLNRSEFKIISIENQPATKAGDNYVAVLMRSKVKVERTDGRKESLSYIVKTLGESQDVFFELFVSKCNVFEKEQEMYRHFIPEFEKMYGNVGIEVRFGPKCYYSSDEPPMIIMEDLLNYEMVDKFTGFDQDHAESGLKLLAKFHAASMVYKEMHGSFSNDFSSGLFNMKVEERYQVYLDDFMDSYIEALKKLPNGEKFAKEAEKWRGKLFAMICECLKYDESSFNVLNHGDPWSNNIMFSYKENETIRDIKLVDFQMVFWGSVAFDLYYFMISSWNCEIKVKKFDELIEFYHRKLTESLKALKFQGKIPNLGDLKAELSKRKFLASALTVELMPFPLSDCQYTEGEVFFKKLYSNPRIVKILSEVIPWLDQQNALEFQ